VTCDEARLLIGANPHASLAELEEHVQGCAGCTHFREEMLTLDGHIQRALQQPPDLARPRRARAPLGPWRQWALAASVALISLAVIGTWLLRPSESLAHEVVVHVQAEPESWLATQQVSAADIDKALKGAGVTLDVTSPKILYAQSCWFHGHYVPHLVLQTAHGPATVMILRHDQVRSRQNFHEAGLTGVIVPAEHGSIAVLTQGGDSVDDVAARMQQDVHWLPQAP
jgi:hypothetical protein